MNGALNSTMGFLQKALPWIGAAATGNVPALIALAASKVSDAIGGPPIAADPTAIATAVAGASPEQLLALQAKELEMKDHAMQLGFQNAQEMARIGLQEQQTYVADTADARAKNATNDKVFWLGISVLVIFGLVMGASLYGSYQILTGGITIKDVAVVAAIAGFVGSIVGYVASNAQQVIGYFFGSSKGSSDKTEAMASAVKQLGEATGK